MASEIGCFYLLTFEGLRTKTMRYWHYEMHTHHTEKNRLGYRMQFFTVLLLLSSIAITTLEAQDVQSNPLSRMAYGTLKGPVAVAWQGMGGVGVGLNDSQVINLKNPAAYAGTDSLSFLMDVGVSVNMGRFQDVQHSRNAFLGGLEYVAIQFPVYRNLLGLSFGVKPFSFSGYGLVSTSSIGKEDKAVLTQTFTGKGAIQKAYLGLAGRVFDRFYIGANVNYLFGHLSHTVATTPNSTNMSQSIMTNVIRLRDFGVDLGMQYLQPLDTETKDFLIVGATYSPTMPLRPTITVQSNENAGDPLRPKIETKVERMNTRLPNEVAVGFSWTRPNKYVLGLDVAYSGWGRVPSVFGNDGVTFEDSYSAGLGFEYLPNVFSRKYSEVIKYRLGMSYSGSYLKFSPVGQTHTIGASLGMGLPVNFFGTERPSVLNLSLNYDRTFGEKKRTGITLDVIKLTLGITFNETWFRELRIY